MSFVPAFFFYDKKMIDNKKTLILLFAFLGISIAFFHCSPLGDSGREMHLFRGQTMGTFYSVKIIEPVQDTRSTGNETPVTGQPTGPIFDKTAIKNGIEQVLDQVNQQMSTYRPDSEISRFNKYRGNDWFPVSHDLADVVEQALKVSALSGGAFDITVGPLVNLWGFGPTKRPLKIPDAGEIEKARLIIGYDKISVRIPGAGSPEPPALKKMLPEIYCDLAGIAKGYGVDQVARYLESAGIKEYLVEIGGEVRTKGKNQKNQWWLLGVITADGTARVQRAFPLVNAAMATSGDYFNYFEEDGVRYSHTIDPSTGKPITHKLASVSVIASSCVVADAMATALDVLGPEKGYELAIKENLAVFMLIKGDGKNVFIEKMTPQFKKVLEGPRK